MPVSSKHFLYATQERNWKRVRDCISGEDVVKDAGQDYLPMPGGFSVQMDGGNTMYDAYRARSVFPDILDPTHRGMVGVIHRVEVQIEGLDETSGLGFLWEKCTKDGLTLEAFHRQITSEILITGRYCILTDVPAEGGDGMPYFAGYQAEQLINWNSPAHNLFVLNETAKFQSEDDEFSWVDREQYRVLRFKDGYTQQVYEGSTPGEELAPIARGAKALPEIPFVVVGPRNLSLELDIPPLLGVARASLAIYRLDADYRHQLFNSGQETAVFTGDMENYPRVLGSGVVVGMPTGSDAKYLSPSCTGIAAHRTAIMDERASAVAAGVRLFEDKGDAESGEALRLRASAQTATLTTISQASAQALERSLRYAAMFLGKDPKGIVVKPNLKFVDTTLTPADAASLVTVWQSGGIAWETLYENLQRGEIASAERTAEEEKELIDQEALDKATTAGTGGIDPATGLPIPSGGAGGAGGAGGNPARFVENGDGLDIVPGG